MREFDELNETMAEVMVLCPWDRSQSVHDWLHSLLDEAGELEAAVAEWSKDEMAEELGDVLICCVALARESNLDLADVLACARDKMRRRHPWLDDDDVPVPQTIEEANALWRHAKQAEKRHG